MGRPSQLSKNIRMYRADKGLNQDQLAERLGVSPITISLWEGGSTPNTKGMMALSRELKCTVNRLFEDLLYVRMH